VWRLSAGFTLVEMVVVMLLAAILVAVTATRWDATDATAPSQADLLARNIRHMQMLAMSWGQSLSLTAAGSSYSVACVTTGVAPCNVSPVIDPASGQAFSVTLSNGVTIGAASTTIDSMGRPVPVTTSTTYTLNAGASTWTVSVAPLTGFTTVSSP
jgi:prepilin-type N-terminal cleavage/methylation domain-containing protein